MDFAEPDLDGDLLSAGSSRWRQSACRLLIEPVRYGVRGNLIGRGEPGQPIGACPVHTNGADCVDRCLGDFDLV